MKGIYLIIRKDGVEVKAWLESALDAINLYMKLYDALCDGDTGEGFELALSMPKEE